MRCTVLLPLTQICFHPVHISTPKGAYQRMLPLKAHSVNQTHSHHVLSDSHFYGWVNSFAYPGASDPQPFGYEYYALTNGAITTLMKSLVSADPDIFTNIGILLVIWYTLPATSEKTEYGFLCVEANQTPFEEPDSWHKFFSLNINENTLQ